VERTQISSGVLLTISTVVINAMTCARDLMVDSLYNPDGQVTQLDSARFPPVRME